MELCLFCIKPSTCPWTQGHVGSALYQYKHTVKSPTQLNPKQTCGYSYNIPTGYSRSVLQFLGVMSLHMILPDIATHKRLIAFRANKPGCFLMGVTVVTVQIALLRKCTTTRDARKSRFGEALQQTRMYLQQGFVFCSSTHWVLVTLYCVVHIFEGRNWSTLSVFIWDSHTTELHSTKDSINSHIDFIIPSKLVYITSVICFVSLWEWIPTDVLWWCGTIWEPMLTSH